MAPQTSTEAGNALLHGREMDAARQLEKRKTTALRLWLLDSTLEILVLPDAFEYHDFTIAKKPTLSTRKGILGLEAQTVILFDGNLVT